MLRRCLVLLAVVGLLAGCASSDPLSANIAADAWQGRPFKLSGFLSVEDGLREARFNFEGALSVGITDKRITSALQCVTGVMDGLNIQMDPNTPSTLPTFIPKRGTALGQGSILLIRTVQAQALTGSGGIAVPAGCDAQIGQMVLDVARANANALPGGGLLPKLR